MAGSLEECSLHSDAAVMSALFSPAGRDDPRSIVSRSSIPGCRYAVVDAVLRDPRFRAPEIAQSDDLMFATLGRWLLRTDGDRHARMRARFAGLFTARRVEQYREPIAAEVASLLDRMAAAPAVDLVGDFAAPLPHVVVCDVLGIPARSRVQLAHDLATIGRGFANQRDHEHVAAGNDAMANALALLSDELAVRERRPGTDLLSRVALAGYADAEDRIDVVANCLFFMTAGQYTTTVLIAGGAELLSRHPDQRDALIADPTLWPGAVEELLRYLSPETLTGVAASEDATVAGVSFTAGSRPLIVYLGANNDPDMFPDPDRFDVRRDASAHLAFSAGRHFCLGAPLVRLEAHLALASLFGRFPRLRTGQPRWRGSAPIRQIDALPVELR